MSRPPRLELPGVPQHVIQRGNNRAGCFFGDADRRFYLKCLAESAARRGCDVHAYVLMSNHVHLLVTPSEAGAMGAMMQDLGRRYVRVINTIQGRTGTLWEARFKSSLVDSENYLLTCHRYIELNPVRARLVSDPGSYAWSSHAHYTADRTSRLITEHPVYLGLGATSSERQVVFRSLFATSLDDRLVAQIRNAINTDSALGSDSFMDDMEGKLGRSVRPPTRGRPCKSVTGKLL
jgi:REP-associated tyrosine transposase